MRRLVSATSASYRGRNVPKQEAAASTIRAILILHLVPAGCARRHTLSHWKTLLSTCGKDFTMAALAESTAVHLPPRLVNFFAKYPPRLYSMHFTGVSIPTISQKIAREGNKKTGESPTITAASTNTATSTPKSISTSTSPAATSTSIPTDTQTQTTSLSDTTPIDTSSAHTPSAPSSGSSEPLLDPETAQPIFDSADQPPNPFLPYRNPATGRWRGALISLRRQAELYKLARHYGVEPLLPPSRKSSAFKQARLLERGAAGAGVKGTGLGEKVKGHKWERSMGVTLQKRINAMEKMPELIREWRMRGNGRGWKRYPK